MKVWKWNTFPKSPGCCGCFDKDKTWKCEDHFYPSMSVYRQIFIHSLGHLILYSTIELPVRLILSGWIFSFFTKNGHSKFVPSSMGNKYASYLFPNIHTTGANIFGCAANQDCEGSDSCIACHAIRHHTTLANQWCWCWIAIILTMDFLRGRTWPLWTRSLLVVKILLGSVQGAGCRAVEFKDKTLPKALRTLALTALTSNFGLVGLVRWVWLGRFGLVGLVW